MATTGVTRQPLVFVDIETTGGSHGYSRVLEIGVVRVEDHQVVDSYSTLVSSDSHVPASITALTGITDDDVVGAPRFEHIVPRLTELFHGATFVAHNVQFDYGFIRMEFHRLRLPYTPNLMCTVQLSRKLFPQYSRHNLQALIDRHGLRFHNRHRALDDAMAIWQFYQLCLYEFDLDTMDDAIIAQLQATSSKSGFGRAAFI